MLSKYQAKNNNEKNILIALLNIISIKNSLTKQKRYKISDEKVYHFDCEYNRIWQSIPEEIYGILQ